MRPLTAGGGGTAPPILHHQPPNPLKRGRNATWRKRKTRSLSNTDTGQSPWSSHPLKLREQPGPSLLQVLLDGPRPTAHAHLPHAGRGRSSCSATGGVGGVYPLIPRKPPQRTSWHVSVWAELDPAPGPWGCSVGPGHRQRHCTHTGTMWDSAQVGTPNSANERQPAHGRLRKKSRQ